jgi:signal transduction histidine kinase
MSKEKTSKSLPGWIELGTILTLLVPLLYTAGWSYACHYFEKFHLGLLGLNIPREYFFLYSFWVIREEFLSFLVLLFILFAISLVWGYHRQVASAMIAKGRGGGLFFAIRVISIPIITHPKEAYQDPNFWSPYVLVGR